MTAIRKNIDFARAESLCMQYDLYLAKGKIHGEWRTCDVPSHWIEYGISHIRDCLMVDDRHLDRLDALQIARKATKAYRLAGRIADEACEAIAMAEENQLLQCLRALEFAGITSRRLFGDADRVQQLRELLLTED